jgi:hypothetical protein
MRARDVPPRDINVRQRSRSCLGADRDAGLHKLRNLMKERLLIRQGNTLAAIVFSPEDPLIQAYKYSRIEFKIVPPSERGRVIYRNYRIFKCIINTIH